jgi:hypothetical protein
MNLWADAVLVDLALNAIRLRVPGLDLHEASTGVLDVGANGRLLGVEMDETYITVMESPRHQESYTRSAVVALTISGDDPAYVAFPRRGPEYEITYPTGNECWQLTTVNGQLIQVCAVIGNARVEPAGGSALEEGSRL